MFVSNVDRNKHAFIPLLSGFLFSTIDARARFGPGRSQLQFLSRGRNMAQTWFYPISVRKIGTPIRKRFGISPGARAFFFREGCGSPHGRLELPQKIPPCQSPPLGIFLRGRPIFLGLVALCGAVANISLFEGESVPDVFGGVLAPPKRLSSLPTARNCSMQA